MQTRRVIRFWHIFHREPSAVAELPIAVSAMLWSIGASLDPTVLHPPESWFIPGAGMILGGVGIYGTRARRALRIRLGVALLLAIFWILLAYAAWDTRGIKAYIACYSGMAMSEILSAIELSGSVIYDRYVAGKWLPARIQAACDGAT